MNVNLDCVVSFSHCCPNAINRSSVMEMRLLPFFLLTSVHFTIFCSVLEACLPLPNLAPSLTFLGRTISVLLFFFFLNPLLSQHLPLPTSLTPSPSLSRWCLPQLAHQQRPPLFNLLTNTRRLCHVERNAASVELWRVLWNLSSLFFCLAMYSVASCMNISPPRFEAPLAVTVVKVRWHSKTVLLKLFRLRSREPVSINFEAVTDSFRLHHIVFFMLCPPSVHDICQCSATAS